MVVPGRYATLSTRPCSEIVTTVPPAGASAEACTCTGSVIRRMIIGFSIFDNDDRLPSWRKLRSAGERGMDA
jgi:hypothetical protein